MTELGVQARGDLQQLTVLLADQLVTEVAPHTVLQTADRAVRARDDMLEDMLKDAVAVSTADLWKRMREHQADVDALVSECHTLAAGAILRHRGADGGLCAVADDLLAEVNDGLPVDWPALTVPGSEDRTSYRTGVIGLRCSARGFWSLPVALHEMGHVMAQTLDTSGPGQPSHNPVWAVLVEGGSPASVRNSSPTSSRPARLGRRTGRRLCSAGSTPRMRRPRYRDPAAALKIKWPRSREIAQPHGKATAREVQGSGVSGECRQTDGASCCFLLS